MARAPGYPAGAPPAAAAPQKLTAAALARARPEEEKQMLGEALYPLIHE
jgi:polyadenylate-binding protein